MSSGTVLSTRSEKAWDAGGDKRVPGLPQATNILLMATGVMLVVIGLWGLYGLHTGFSEGELTYPSDLHPGINGFLFFLPERRFTSLFYHLSYLIGAAVGERGSFVPYQLVYAALWAFRAVLTYLIVQKLMPEMPALSVFAGLFAALNVAADAALNWIEQLNQFGFIFLMLLSFYLLLVAVESSRIGTALGWAVASTLSGYLALWSYESPLPVICAFPVAVALLRRDVPIRRLVPVFTVYFIPVAAFAGENAQYYLASLGHAVNSYQASVSRHHFSLIALTSDLSMHVENSIIPWHWPQAYFSWQRAQEYAISSVPVLLAIVLLVPPTISREEKSPGAFHITKRLLIFGAVSFGLLVASYLVILVLNDNKQLWRTEFLPGFASACVFAALLYAFLGLVRMRIVRAAVAVVVFSVAGFFAMLSGVNSGFEFHALWERQRVILASVISNAPRVANGTLFIIRNIDRQHDPFGHQMWLDLALRMAYPQTTIAGIYTFADGGLSPGMSVEITDNGEPHLLPFEGTPTLFHSTPNARIKYFLVFNFDPSSGAVDPVLQGPIKVGNGEIPAARYDFCAAVTGSKPDPIAVRRFGPIVAGAYIDCVKDGHR